MDEIRIIFLSFIQAVTEFLPISSSGHVLFFKSVFDVNKIPIMFDVLVHVGSLVAILAFYYRDIISKFKGMGQEIRERQKEKSHVKWIIYAAISTSITFVFYLVFKKHIDSRFGNPSDLFIMFLITSGFLLLTFFFRNRPKTVVINKGILLPLVVGLVQGLAIFPGISRSGVTISLLLILGVKNKEAAFYSFFLAIPAILGALIISCFNSGNMTYLVNSWEIMTVAFGVSAIFSYIFLFLLIGVLKKGRFWFFSIYTLIMAILSLAIF